MNKIKIGLVIGILAITSLASAATLSPSEYATRQQMIDFAQYFPNLVSQYYPDIAQSEPKLGSVTSPSIIGSTRFEIGGFTEWSERKPLLSNSSTTCSFKLTTASTSQLVAFNLALATSSVGGILELGYSPLSPNATSTLIAQAMISSGSTAFVIATSTAGTDHLGGLTIPNVLQPGGFLNAKYSGGLVSGACEYKVREL